MTTTTTTLNAVIEKLHEIVKNNPSLGNNEVEVEYERIVEAKYDVDTEKIVIENEPMTSIHISGQTPIFKLFLN